MSETASDLIHFFTLHSSIVRIGVSGGFDEKQISFGNDKARKATAKA
jgi:hypothetical protein